MTNKKAEIQYCDPRYIEATVNYFPARYDLANKCNLPFGIVCQPMANTGIPLPV